MKKQPMKKQPRWKSIPMWMAVMALIYIIFKDWFGIVIPSWEGITSLVISILTILFGIVNSPTTKGGF